MKTTRMNNMVTLNEGKYNEHNNSVASMCITRMSDSMTSTLHGEDMYDEDGLHCEYNENEPNK